MKKKSIISFFVAFMCLFIGACCHGLRTSGDPVKFKIGVAIGVIMILSAVGFGIAGLVMLMKEKKEKKVEPILQTLTDLNIPFELQEHKAIFSEKDAEDVVITLPGIDVKNLFVKDKHNNYGLVSMNLHKRADLKKIATEFGYDRLSFCNPDELMQYLAITPGSVTPLCIQADVNCKVKVLFDRNFVGQKVIVHPLRNTASISMEFSDLCRFVEHFGHTFKLGDVYKELFL